MSNLTKNPVDINIDLSGVTLSNIALFAAGAAGAGTGFYFLQKASLVFAGAMPFLLGGTLFAAIVGSFFYLMKMLKLMRVRSSLRLSFWEGFTALAVFTVMGYFATACMQLFTGSGGNPLSLWCTGSIACAGFATVFGLGRFVAGLWNDSNSSKS